MRTITHFIFKVRLEHHVDGGADLYKIRMISSVNVSRLLRGRTSSLYVPVLA